jgi:hypothetical protein
MSLSASLGNCCNCYCTCKGFPLMIMLCVVAILSSLPRTVTFCFFCLWPDPLHAMLCVKLLRGQPLRSSARCPESLTFKKDSSRMRVSA